MHPLISVITVCYNSETTIRKTIESVLEQDLSQLEYLIIDGTSTDQTLQIIDEYKESFSNRLRVISEPDNGWYDAMNKGILNSTGDYIVFLNSDDYFDKKAIITVEDYIEKNRLKPNCVVYGDSTNIYKSSKGELLFRRIIAPDHLAWGDKSLRNGMCGIRHQSMFTGREVFQTIGLLDLKYRLHADWDFLVRCIYSGMPMKHVPANLTFYSMYGVSTKPDCKERHILRKNNSLYKFIDLDYIRDRIGIKATGRRIFGEIKWNDILFYLHKRGKV